MSKKMYAIASGVFSILSLIALFYGAWLYDIGTVSSKTEVFMPPALGSMASVFCISIASYLQEY